MAGELTPLVMLPRYTTYAGERSFTTIPMDVTEYSKVYLNVWRGPIVNAGGTPKFRITLEESTDQATWATVSGTTAGEEIADDVEEQIIGDLRRRWFRVKVALEGTMPIATCWAVGFLEGRES